MKMEKLIEENKKLREMMEELIKAGKEQLPVISNLTGRVKELERKLSRKKKIRTRRHRAAAAAPALASVRLSQTMKIPLSVRASVWDSIGYFKHIYIFFFFLDIMIYL